MFPKEVEDILQTFHLPLDFRSGKSQFQDEFTRYPRRMKA
jgi:hypothetical protein